jgi:hypothetical protein
LRRFDEMTLSRWDVRVVALSKDTPAQVKAHQARDGLELELLSDAKLDVIRALGLLHRGGLEFATWTVAGIPLGVPSGFKDMAIPTSVLLDEEGVVLWIDQADDYRQRGDEARVAGALTNHFGPPAG